MEVGNFCCVICTGSTICICDNSDQINHDYDVSHLFGKLFQLSVEILEDSLFQELSDFLCSHCKSKFYIIHNLFVQLEEIQLQLDVYKKEIREELLARHHSKEFLKNQTWGKTDVLSSKIIQSLQIPLLDDGTLRQLEPISKSISYPTTPTLRSSRSGNEISPKYRAGTNDNDIITLKDLRIVLNRIDLQNIVERPTLKAKSKRGTGRSGKNSSRNSESKTNEKNTNERESYFILTNLKTESDVEKETEEPTNTIDNHIDNHDDAKCNDDYECPDPDPPKDDGDEDYIPEGHPEIGINPQRKEETEQISTSSGPFVTEFDSNFDFPFPPIRTKKRKNPEHLLRKCPEPGCTSKVRYTEERLFRHHRLIHEVTLTSKGKIKKKVWKSKLYSCTYDGCTSKAQFTKNQLTDHINQIHLRIVPDDAYLKRCPEPGCKSKVRFTEERLAAHIMRNHNKEWRDGPNPVQCDLCGKILCSQKVLTNHKRKHTGERFNCDECSAKFRTEIGLNDHKAGQHGSESKQFSCEICGRTFLKLNTLKSHIDRHNPQEMLTCRACPRQFKTRSELDRHERFSHAKELSINLDNITCKICGKVYSTEGVLKLHVKSVHQGEFRYVCSSERCTYKTNTRSDLVEHLTVHSSETPFSCEQCSKQFKLEKRLKQHLRNHEKDYPYVCSICHKRYLNDARLLKHALTHQDKRFVDRTKKVHVCGVQTLVSQPF